MADRKSMTLQALRALARKVLGSGYSKLKKQELAQAIEAAEKRQAAPAKAPARPAKGSKPAAAPARPAPPAKREAAPASAAAKVRSAAARASAAGKAVKEAAAAVRAKAGKVAGKVTGKASSRPAAARAAPAKDKAASVARKARAMGKGLAARAGADAGDQPDPESYFVARVRGEEAVRDAPHPMTEAAIEGSRKGRRRAAAEPAQAWDEQLGELPWSYGDDLLVALPRDPRTLYLWWDHAAETVRRGWEGLDGGKAEIWVFARLPDGGWERVRVVEFALEARSWYVHDLEPGRVYRAEIHLVDRSQDRLLPQGSNPVGLPAVGPSPVIDDRFARIDWGARISRWLEAAAEGKPGAPFAEELRAQLARLSDWSRFGGGTWGAAAGGMGGRPFSPASAPGGPGGGPSSPAPSSPGSPWGGR